MVPKREFVTLSTLSKVKLLFVPYPGALRPAIAANQFAVAKQLPTQIAVVKRAATRVATACAVQVG
jgi:hypothetical protein